jgi:hypothetical protein
MEMEQTVGNILLAIELQIKTHREHGASLQDLGLWRSQHLRDDLKTIYVQ